LFSKFKLLRF